MTPAIEAARPTPRAFLSYAWENEAHRQWVREFAIRLRADGVNVTLDQWEVQPGDQLPAFMERSVRENDYVIIICTPSYAERSNHRRGGVGYEGDIMTAEVLTHQNHRKFIPIYRAGNQWESAAPTWLRGKYYIDLRGDPYGEEQYQDLITTLHGLRPAAPPIGARPAGAPLLNTVEPISGVAESMDANREPDPIRILGIVVDEVTTPGRDGTPGSALYRVPFQLNRQPSAAWVERFIGHWNHPPRWTTRHRPGIAYVNGDRVYLDGTTMEEVERFHRDTLTLAIRVTNEEIAALAQQRRAEEERAREERADHERAVRDAAQRIKFE